MNKQLLTLISVAALGLTSCDDKDFFPGGDGGVPVASGTELVFGTVLDAKTRTNYGTETADGIPIHWTFSDNDDSLLDQILIYCPEGAEGYRSAQYKVRPAGKDSEVPAAAEKLSEDKYVAAGEEGKEHRFHGFYPYDAIYMSEHSDTATSVKALLPMNQVATFRGVTNETTGAFIAEPDMKLCHMAAYSPQTPTQGKGISLSFKAIPTVFDITMAAPQPITEEVDDQEVTTYPDCTVESVVIRCNDDASIAGGYSWNFKSGVATPMKVSTLGSEEPASEIEVLLMSDTEDNEGDEPVSGVKLATGKTLNLKVFAVPDPNVKEITVEIYSSTQRLWTKTLTTQDTNGKNILMPGQVHKVRLGNLDESASYEEQSSWMTNLSDDILITQMSIPGSVSSLSYLLDENSPYRQQDNTIKDQFDAGIRAFRCHITTASGTDAHVPASTGKKLMVTFDGIVDPQKTQFDLGNVIHELHQEMQGRSNKEFCVLVLSDLFNPDTPKTHRDYEDLYATLKETVSTLVSEKICVENLTADTKLGDVRGKILIYYQLNAELGLCDSEFENEKEDNPLYSSYSYGSAPVSLTGGCYAGWYRIEQWLSFDDQTAYNPNNYGNVGIQDKEYILGWKNWDKDDGTGFNSHAIGLGLDRWKNMEGAPVLMSWWTRASLATPQLYPLVFGHIGRYEFTGTSPLSPGLSSQTAKAWETGDYNDYDIPSIKNRIQGVWDSFVNTKSNITYGLAAWNALVTVNNMNWIDSLGRAKEGDSYDGLLVGDYTNENFRKGVVSHSNIDFDRMRTGGYNNAAAGWNNALKSPGTVWVYMTESSPQVTGSSIPLNAVNAMWSAGRAVAVNDAANKNVIFSATLSATAPSNSSAQVDWDVYNGFLSSRQIIKPLERSIMGGLMSMIYGYKIDNAYKCPLGLMFLSFVPKNTEVPSSEYVSQIPQVNYKEKIWWANKSLIKAMVEHNTNFEGVSR